MLWSGRFEWDLVHKMLKTNFTPIHTRRVHEEICDAIRAKLIARELKIGDRLPSERELADMFSVSRTAVREALRTLEIAGIVDLKLGSKGGAFIALNATAQVARSFRDMVDFGEISLPMLLEARQQVVESTVKLAAERASKADIAALRANLNQIIQLSEAGKFGERLEKAVEFYTLIANAAGNAALSAIVESLSTVIKGFLLDLDPAPYEDLVAQRKRVIDCLADQDASGAVKAVRAYLQDVTNYLLKKRTPRSGRARSASKAISAGGPRGVGQ